MIVMVIISKSEHNRPPDILYSTSSELMFANFVINISIAPARDAIEYKVAVLDDSPGGTKASPYVGESSPELDAEWYKLLQCAI